MPIRLLSILVIALLAAAQSKAPPGAQQFRQRISTTLRIDPLSSLDEVRGVRFSAESVDRRGSLIRLKDAVRIQTSAFVLLADEVEYNRDTGEINTLGNVRLQLTTPGPQ